MKLLTNFFGFMTAILFLAILLALFTDTSTGDNPYTLGEAFIGWVVCSVIFTLLRRRPR